MSKYRMIDLARDIRFKIDSVENDTYVAIVEQRPADYDNIGALYYVVAVVLIYGLSIVMMIASHIRRNKHDGQLRSYLKEMATLRKKNRREQLLEKMTTLATQTGLTVTTQPVKAEETSFSDNRRFKNQDSSLYARLPSEVEMEAREGLLSKNSTSDNDSVFLYGMETPLTPRSPRNESSPKTPRTPKGNVTPKLTPKFGRDGRIFTNIQVINENAPL